jgi:putative endonuclease
MKFFVYILQSEIDQSYYYGHSKDTEKRLLEHNSGKVRSTKSKQPWNIHYSEHFETKSDAYKSELFFKTVEGYKYLKNKGII